MSCNLTSAIALDCIDSIGGIKKAYIGVDILVVGATMSTDNTITGLTGTGTFYQYELPKDTANFVETGTISEANGTAFWAQALTINLQKLTAATRNELLLLSRNRDIKIIFEDNNGNLWLLGKERGGTMTSLTSNSGTAPGDANNYILTITANEPAMAYQIDALTSVTGFVITLVA